MWWSKKKNVQSEQAGFQVGDKVWVNTFVHSYKGTVVGFTPPDVMQSGKRVIVEVEGTNIPVSLSFLSKQETS